MPDDLGAVLDQWPYNPDRPYRIICGCDGRPKLQARTPAGIHQYELDGRPDGRRPAGEESLLDLCEKRLAAHCVRHHAEAGFTLPARVCRELAAEVALYHERYACLYEAGDFERTARDTARNLRCLDLLARYAEAPDVRGAVERYRAAVIQMNRASRAMLAVRRGLYDAAAMEIARGIGEVEALAGAADEGRGRTPTRALACLRRLGREIQARRPPTLAEDLQRQLREAVSAEDYERAARLRDRLHALGVPAADGRRPVQRGTLPGATSFIDTSSK